MHIAIIFFLTSVILTLMPGLMSASSSKTPKIPQRMVENVGQYVFQGGASAADVVAAFDNSGMVSYLSATGVYTVLHRMHASKTRFASDGEVETFRFDLTFVGGNSNARSTFSNPVGGPVRYHSGAFGKDAPIAHGYQQVTMHEVWDGINVVSTAYETGLKTDYVVRIGADPKRIAFRWHGVNAPTVDAKGRLVIKTPLGVVREERPVAWTVDANGLRTAVDVSFVVDVECVRFDVGNYQDNQVLVIDPTRMWATYYTGNKSFKATRTAIDFLGNVILTGTTLATNIPSTPGVLQRNKNANYDGFLAKFDERGKHIWSTYYGSDSTDEITDVATDSNGVIWVVGITTSKKFPDRFNMPKLLTDSVRRVEGFVTSFTPIGLYRDGWLVGYKEEDYVTSIALYKQFVAIGGYSHSGRIGEPIPTNFRLGGDNTADAFVYRFRPSAPGSDLYDPDWYSWHGGGLLDEGRDVAMDADGSVYLTGTTLSSNLPTTTGAYQTTRGAGGDDAFLVKYSSRGTILWSTYFGGAGIDRGNSVAVSSTGDVVIAGSLQAGGMATPGAHQATLAGGQDGFLTMFSSNGVRKWTTYYGGGGGDVLNDIAFTPLDELWCIGTAGSFSNFPQSDDAYQATPGHPSASGDAMFALFDTTGLRLYGSYYGGPPQDPLPEPGNPPQPVPPNTDFGNEFGTSIAVDGDAYLVTGLNAISYRTPTTTGAFQDSTVMDKDTLWQSSFIAYWSNCDDSLVNITANGPLALCHGNDARTLSVPAGFKRYLWSTGSTTRNTTVQDSGKVSIIVWTAKGCRIYDTVRISRSPLMTIQLNHKAMTMCRDSSVRITATPVNGIEPFKYQWKRIESGAPFIIGPASDSMVQVNPSSTSRYEITITDANGCQAKDTATVTLLIPLPTAVEGTIDIGSLDACTSSFDTTIVVRNPMPYDVTVTGATATIPGISVITPLNPGVKIPPGQTVVIRVRVSPASQGTFTGVLRLTGIPCVWEVPFTFSGSKAEVTAFLRPSVLNLQQSACDANPVEQETEIVNSGTDPLIVSAPTIPAPFSVIAPSFPVTVAPGSSVKVMVSLSMAGVGVVNQAIQFPFESGTCVDTLRLSANGRRDNVEISASPVLVTALLDGCQDQVDTTIVIRNNGTIEVTGDWFNLPGNYSTTPSGPIKIAPGDSTTVRIRGIFAATGVTNETLTFLAVPCNVTVQITFDVRKNGIGFNTPGTIAFGEVSTCSGPNPSAERSATITFTAASGSSTLTDVVTGPDVSHDLTTGTQLAPGVPLTFNVTWQATRDGDFVDSLILNFEPCSIRRVIRLTGTRTSPGISATPTAIALGTVTTTTASGTALFTNTGTDTLRVQFSATSTTTITAIRPPNTTNILPGTILEVDFTTTCAGRTTLSDTITCLVVEPCELTAEAHINGVCDITIVPPASTVKLDELSAQTGDRISIPLRLTAATGLDDAGAADFRAVISYNPNVLVGRGSTPDCYLPGAGDNCAITVTGRRTSNAPSTLVALDFTVVLGDADHSMLTLETFEWTAAPQVPVTKIDGKVTVTDICREGGNRFVRVANVGGSIEIAPQPATDAVLITMHESDAQPYQMIITDRLGRAVYSTTMQRSGGTTVLSKSLDISTLSSGSYFVTILGRNHTDRIPLLIVR